MSTRKIQVIDVSNKSFRECCDILDEVKGQVIGTTFKQIALPNSMFNAMCIALSLPYLIFAMNLILNWK